MIQLSYDHQFFLAPFNSDTHTTKNNILVIYLRKSYPKNIFSYPTKETSSKKKRKTKHNKSTLGDLTAPTFLAHCIDQHHREILVADEQLRQAASAGGTLGDGEIDGGSKESLSPQSQIPDRALALRSRRLGIALLRLKRHAAVICILCRVQPSGTCPRLVCSFYGLALLAAVTGAHIRSSGIPHVKQPLSGFSWWSRPVDREWLYGQSHFAKVQTINHPLHHWFIPTQPHLTGNTPNALNQSRQINHNFKHINGDEMFFSAKSWNNSMFVLMIYYNLVHILAIILYLIF